MTDKIDLPEILRLHGIWIRCEGGGVRADLSRASLRGADLNGANLRWANLSETDLRGANLSNARLRGASLRGADLRRADMNGADLGAGRVAACYWTDHGECGRELLGVALPDDSGTLRLRLYCGCFAGSAQDLRDYIAAGEERYRQSRTAALDFALARMTEMGVSCD